MPHPSSLAVRNLEHASTAAGRAASDKIYPRKSHAHGRSGIVFIGTAPEKKPVECRDVATPIIPIINQHLAYLGMPRDVWGDSLRVGPPFLGHFFLLKC